MSASRQGASHVLVHVVASPSHVIGMVARAASRMGDVCEYFRQAAQESFVTPMQWL